MTEQKRLLAILKKAAKPRQKPRIVCYDRAWAGLPRITVLDPPRRTKSRRRYQWARPVVHAPVVARQSPQLELPL